MAKYDTIKQRERTEHNKTYKRRAIGQLKSYSCSDYFSEETVPSYEDYSNIYGEVNGIFLNRILDVLQSFEHASPRILDYGCGMGKMSVCLALMGYRNVYGFDLSDEGVSFGMQLASISGVAEHVFLRQMDAEHLKYPDNFFDVVIGKAVLHHTIKYRKTAQELQRVLKPGGIAIFKENIGNNPVLKLARFLTMDLLGRHGDVNITTSMLDEYAKGFSYYNVYAWHFLYMLKRFFWKPGPQAKWRKLTMRALKKFDDLTVHRSDCLRIKLCGESIITLVL